MQKRAGVWVGRCACVSVCACIEFCMRQDETSWTAICFGNVGFAISGQRGKAPVQVNEGSVQGKGYSSAARAGVQQKKRAAGGLECSMCRPSRSWRSRLIAVGWKGKFKAKTPKTLAEASARPLTLFPTADRPVRLQPIGSRYRVRFSQRGNLCYEPCPASKGQKKHCCDSVQ